MTDTNRGHLGGSGMIFTFDGLAQGGAAEAAR
jgi:hypothetical protein